MSSTPIARVPAGTFGPYLGMSDLGGLAVWASSERGARSWFAQSLMASGLAQGDPRRLGDAPSELGLVTIRPVKDRFAMLSTSKTSDGEVVRIALLSPTGEIGTGPVSIGRSSAAALWVEVVPTPRGLSVLWAAAGSGGRAEIWLAELNTNLESTSPPRVVARDAGAWQAVPFGKGVALAVTHVGKGNQHGPIEVSLLGETSAPQIVNAEISADLDLDMAAVGDRLLIAWSDHRGGENRVYSAALDAQGKLVAPPSPATPPLGEQAVLRLVPAAEGGKRAYLAWESLDAQGNEYRVFEVAELDRTGHAMGPRGSVEYWKMDGSVPEITASANGITVLTLAPVCVTGTECASNAEIAPAYAELALDLSVRSSEPLFTSTNTASLAWNLTCPSNGCFVLSAETGVPSPVALTRLAPITGRYRTPAQRVELAPRPRIVADVALATTDALSKIALTETNAGVLVGWLTDFDPTTPWVRLTKPTADGRFEPLRAKLDLRAYSATEPFDALTPVENLSLRAHSLGGIALSGGKDQKDTLLAWAGLDGGQPQVFLTLVDKSGKKLSQRMLTHKLGELNDVAVTSSGADYLVAWVDERNKDPELYATKVNHALNKIAPEQRITQVPGSVTDVSLVPTKGGALSVWADARESEDPGIADVYAVAIRGTDASRVGNETCLQKTRAHSFSPLAVPYGAGAFVAWLEAASESGDAEPAHLAYAELDESARVVGSVQRVGFGAGTPVSFGLECAQQLCRLVIAVDSGSRGELYALGVQGGKASAPVRIRSTNGAPSNVAPVVHGRDVFVAEPQQGRSRLRRLSLEW